MINNTTRFVIHKDILGATFLQNQYDKRSLIPRYAYNLFTLSSKAWVYFETICLDVRNGKSYFCRCDIEHLNGADVERTYFHPISYDALKEYAKEVGEYEHYKNIDENNWQTYIPPEKLGINTQKLATPVTIESNPHLQPLSGVCEFFFSLQHNTASPISITYLRLCNTGYRLFFARYLDGTVPVLFFHKDYFLKKETQIQEILLEKNPSQIYDCYDRLLNDQQAHYVMQLFSNHKAYHKPWTPENTTAYMVQNENIINCNEAGFAYINDILENLAQYGSVALPGN